MFVSTTYPITQQNQTLPLSPTIPESASVVAISDENSTLTKLEGIYDALYFYKDSTPETVEPFLEIISTQLTGQVHDLALKIAKLNVSALFTNSKNQSLLALASTESAKELLLQAGHAPRAIYKRGFEEIAIERCTSLLQIITKKEQFAFLKSLITKNNFSLFYDALQKADGVPSNEFGTTIRAYAMKQEDPRYLEACDRFGIQEFFNAQFLTDEARKSIALTFLGSEGVTYVGKQNFTDRDYFTFEEDLYPIFHAILQGFIVHYAHKINTSQANVSQVTISQASAPLLVQQLEEINDAIIMAPFAPAIKLVERIKNNQPTLVHTGSKTHSITIAFNGRYLFINNRGDIYPLQQAKIHVYEFNKNKIKEEMIDKLRAVEECDYDIAGEYIYKRFLNALECKPAPKLYELLNNYLVPSDQKFNDCVASNLKAGIRNLFFGFDAHQLDLQKMTAHYEVYKSFCSMLKEEIPYLLELNQ